MVSLLKNIFVYYSLKTLLQFEVSMAGIIQYCVWLQTAVKSALKLILKYLDTVKCPKSKTCLHGDSSDN